MSAPAAAERRVLVAGAGPVGATLALALGRAGVAVTLLDRAPAPAPPDPTDALDVRVSALSAGAVRVLERLGVWERIAPARRGPFRGLEVWEGRARIRFEAAALRESALGAVVENRALIGALAQVLAETAAVTRAAPGVVAALEWLPAALHVHTSAGERYPVALAAGAEGADSPLRALAGIGARVTDFGHSALVTHARTAQPHADIAYQRFLPGGPLALLPLPDGRVSVVWTCASAQAQRLAALDDAAFAAALGGASEWRLGEVLAVDARACLPLRGVRAARYVAPRVALAGDAAHVVHPLAGLGATLGLLDAATLAELAGAAVQRGADPGGAALLRRYERARRTANAPIEAAIEALRRLYAPAAAPLAPLRRVGITLAERAGPLKALLAARASALAGELPALARPGP